MAERRVAPWMHVRFVPSQPISTKEGRARMSEMNEQNEINKTKAKMLRIKSDRLARKALAILDAIPGGQPIHTTRDRNRRERASDLMRQSAELITEAERLEAVGIGGIGRE